MLMYAIIMHCKKYLCNYYFALQKNSLHCRLICCKSCADLTRTKLFAALSVINPHDRACHGNSSSEVKYKKREYLLQIFPFLCIQRDFNYLADLLLLVCSSFRLGSITCRLVGCCSSSCDTFFSQLGGLLGCFLHAFIGAANTF